MNATQIAAFAAATNNEFCDPSYKDGEWLVEAVETKETLEDFIQASEGWAERSRKMNLGEIGGFPFISWEKVQARKGEQRRALSVVDFGDVRVALDADLSYF